MVEVLHTIGGEQVAALSGNWLDNVEPATGKVYGRIAAGDGKDVDRAVVAAAAAFPAWSATPAGERARVLLRLADLVEARTDELGRAECIDNGKPISLARDLDIPRAVANLRFFATAVLHFHSESHMTDGQALNYTLRQPRGVAGIISPWNLPLYLLTWKVAPALATGNTVVAKPSELTPVTACHLGRLAVEAGLPPGVLNIVHGTGPSAGAPLVIHPQVPTVAFTGGTSTGAEIARQAGPMFKKVGLELGGKNPNIVFEDVDLDEALAGSVRSSFANQGQICLSGSRVFVHESIHDTFVERLAAAARSLKPGDPLQPDTRQGALVSEAHRRKVLSYIDMARDEGGTIVCGGGPPADLPDRCRGGAFVEPTVITGLPVSSRVNQEEIFGPVVTVTPFHDERQAVEWANAVPYGLSASVWTRDLSRAHRVAEQVEAGTVWINCWLLRDLRVPFGGVKSSGVGREGGVEALRFHTEPKNVCIRYPREA